MIIAKEVTVWNTKANLNHTYMFDDSMNKVIAYMRNTGTEWYYFKNPSSLDKRRRKFEVIERIEEKTTVKRVEVAGSKGNIYYVTRESNGLLCTCPGNKYHGTCKHIKKVEDEKLL